MPFPSWSRERLGLPLGVIGVAIFGGTLPATRIAVAAIDPMALTALRTAIAGLCSTRTRRPPPAANVVPERLAEPIPESRGPGFAA
jgi:drug/metabolite transporter (DMT)-like permease